MFIRMGNGIGDQTNDGTATISAVCLIAAITGNLDVPGGQFAGGGFGGRAPPVPWLDELLPADMVERLVAPESPRLVPDDRDAGRAGPPPPTTRRS